MKRILLLCFSLMIFSFGFSQDLKPIAEKVRNAKLANKTFAKYKLFTTDQNIQKQNLYRSAADGITVMQLNQKEIQKIVSEKPEALEMSFPFEGETITVNLVKNQILTQDFSVLTDKGDYNYTPGVYYYGIVSGNDHSLVAISFFKDDVIGMASIPNVGNIVIGKTKDSENYVTYNDAKLKKSNSFTCQSDELLENQRNPAPKYSPEMLSAKKTDNCVRIYYEAAYSTYTANTSNVTTTTNWVTAMHNNISTLFTNDGITTALSQVFVWTSTDPYTGSGTGAKLNQFRATRTTFNGDVGQLIKVTNQVSGGIAFLNSLCSTSRYSYVDIYSSYSNVPTYSWNIEAMTHETGHSLGSPHTHACAWNGNDTAIDGCGPLAGYTEGCDGPVPSSAVGGTIMSYCHLTGTGIKFANGFGPQPAALIRNTVNSKGCLGTNCTASCPTTVTSVGLSNVTANSATATITDASSTSWKYAVTKVNGTVITSGDTANKIVNLANLQPGTYYYMKVGTNCSGPQAFQQMVLFLTDANWCSGLAFTDSGGPSLNYGDNEDIIKTFYPSSSNLKLKLTFSQFDLEPRDPGTNELYDYMDIFDGTSVNAPVFANGSQLNGSAVPGPFQATNSAGAITVRFHSDGGLELPGWNATFSCINLGTNETALDNAVSIAPNPVKNDLNVTSRDQIISVKIYDASGKLVLKDEAFKDVKANLNLSKLAPGVYSVSVTTANQTVTKKIIKK